MSRRRSARALPVAVALAGVLLAESAHAAAPVIFLDRCEGGCTYHPGFDDSRTNTSSIVTQTSQLSAFQYGDPSFAAVLACVRQTFAPFAVEVTDVDPGSADHYEIAVAGTSQEIGGIAGNTAVAPFVCGGTSNGIAFAFANTIGDAPDAICWAAAQGAGFLLGLDAVYACGDVMTFLPGCLPKSFLDADSQCGTNAPQPCLCGGTTQNSYQKLLALLPEPERTGSAAAVLLGVALARRLRPGRCSSRRPSA